jgi:hypothetical protein
MPIFWINESRREHIGRDAREHGNPQRGEAQHAPLAPRLGHGREVGVEQPTLRNVGLDIGRVGGEAAGNGTHAPGLKEISLFRFGEIKTDAAK